MPSHRPNMSLHTTSSTSTTSIPTSASPTSSTASPSSPLSPATTQKPSQGYFSSRHTARSATIDTVFHSRSRSKSPMPPTQIPSSSSHKLSKSVSSATSPTQQRYKLDEAIPSPTERHSSFFKQQKKVVGPMGPIGRHSNDWLFGGISLTETAKGLVKGRHDSK